MSKQQITSEEYEQFQQLNEQVDQINKYKSLLSDQIAQIETSINSLNEIKISNSNHQILAQISNGIFIPAALQENNKVIISIGANTAVEKSIPDTIKLLEAEKVGLTSKIIEIEKMLVPLNSELMRIYNEAENVQ